MDTNKKPIDVSKLTPEQYQLEINKFNTQGQTPVNTAVPPVITSDMLKPQPELKLPEKAVPAPSPILAEADALVQTSLEKQAADAKKTQDTNVSDITQLMEAIGGVEGKRGQYQEDAGVFVNQDAIKDIDDQLLVQSRALKAKNEEIRRNPQLTQSMAARLMNEEERKAASTTADLMVTRSLLNRDVDRAIEIANRKVEAELAPLKTQLEAKKFVFDNNKDWLSTLQKTALETAIKKEERLYDEAKQTKLDISNFAMKLAENQAPNDLVIKAMNAGSKEEIMVMPGISKYLMSPSERLQQIKKQNLEFGEALSDIASPGLTVKQRTELLKDATSKQAVARIGVIKAVEEYKKKAEEYKSTGNILRELTTKEKIELDTMLNSTVGSAINVAQGQGAMGDEEAKRIMDDLKVKRLRGERFVPSAADGVISSQKTLLDNDLKAIDSGIPGATDSFEVFAEYKKSNEDDESFFGTGKATTPKVNPNYFNVEI